MSLNTNITNLQEILDKVNALPRAENLEHELNSQSALISEQSIKIAELTEILANKAGGSNGNVKTCTVTIETDIPSSTYLAYTSVNDIGEVVTISDRHAVLSGSGSNRSFTATVVCNTTFAIYFASRAPVYEGYGFSDREPSWYDAYNWVGLLSPKEENAQAFIACYDD